MDSMPTVEIWNEDVLLWFPMVTSLRSVSEGTLIGKPTVPWFELQRQLINDADFLFWFAQYPRKFEEFIAGMYHLDGWTDVILTPQSGDYGRDVIATTYGSCAVRVLDSVKKDMKDRIRYRLDTREIVSREEYIRRVSAKKENSQP